MKVIYIARGLGDYVIELVNAMSEFVEAHVVLSKADEWIGEFLNQEVKVFRSGSPKITDANNIFSLIKISHYVKQIKPDLIHIQSGIIWELALFPIFRKTPFVTTVHDVIKHPMRGVLKYFPQGFLDYAANRSSGIIVHGAYLQSFAKTYYRNQNRKKKIANIDHGVISRYGSGKASVKSRTKGVLVFGTVDAWKGIEYLITCEPIVRKAIPQVQFIVAGNSPDPAYYMALLKSGQKIDMRLRKQRDQEVHDLFSWADVLVLPYIEASQSGALQVGFSFGIPSVVTDVGGLPDVIRDGDNGLVVPTKNSAELAKAIIRILTDNELRERIIDSITSDRENRFNWHNIALKTYDFYQNVMNLPAYRREL